MMKFHLQELFSKVITSFHPICMKHIGPFALNAKQDGAKEPRHFACDSIIKRVKGSSEVVKETVQGKTG